MHETSSPPTDVSLRQAVKKELDWTAGVDPSRILVWVTDSVVELAGDVSSVPQMHAATQAALRVTGVTAVANDIVVRPPFKSPVPDRDIARAVRDSLSLSPVLPPSSIKVAVSDRVTTLTGRVDSISQREEAERLAGCVSNVYSVDNQVIIPRRSMPEDDAQGVHESRRPPHA